MSLKATHTTKRIGNKTHNLFCFGVTEGDTVGGYIGGNKRTLAGIRTQKLRFRKPAVYPIFLRGCICMPCYDGRMTFTTLFQSLFRAYLTFTTLKAILK